MVHALEEIRRVLVPGGILIDLRPLLDQWLVEVVSLREIRKVGRVQDFPAGLADDIAAQQAVAQAEQNRWFQREAEDFFSFIYAWDTPNEMEASLRDDWQDFIVLEEADVRTMRSAWAVMDADARVRLKVKMLITRWKKTI